MSRNGVLAILAVIVAIVGFVLYRNLGSAAPEREVRLALQSEIKKGTTRKQANTDATTWTRLRQFYSKRGYRPLWTDGKGATRAGRDLLEVLEKAQDVGLQPADYQVTALAARLDQLAEPKLLDESQPAALAQVDLLFTNAFLRYGSDLLDGRVTPARVRAGWHTKPRRADFVRVLRRAAEQGRIEATLASLEPAHEGYQRLKDQYRRYREIAERGGWQPIPTARAALGPGRSDARIPILRARLAATGDLPEGRERGAVWDDALEQAVRRFEERHGLEVNGVVGAEDFAALNTPVEARLRQLELNLERWRWLPAQLGERYLLVNIPEFMLHLVENDRTVMSMKVVVGKTYNRTPVFSDRLTYIIFNPTWNVPASIAVNEIVPAMQRDPGYLYRHRMRIFTSGGEEVDPGSIDWSSLPAESFPYSLRQDPWEENALGRIKFMLPNDFDIYLHDTPAGHLFERRERDFSHGCIRVERPVDLAVNLLRANGGWDASRVEEEAASEESRTVELKRPVPTHILYFTTWVDDRGTVHFRDDLYGIDRVHDRALRRYQEPLTRALRRGSVAKDGRS